MLSSVSTHIVISEQNTFPDKYWLNAMIFEHTMAQQRPTFRFSQSTTFFFLSIHLKSYTTMCRKCSFSSCDCNDLCEFVYANIFFELNRISTRTIFQHLTLLYFLGSSLHLLIFCSLFSPLTFLSFPLSISPHIFICLRLVSPKEKSLLPFYGILRVRAMETKQTK